MTRVLAIGLDGFEASFARGLMARGEMPRFEALRQRSAEFLLDHGPAQRTGLAWEHVSSGLSPSAAERWAAVHFDPHHYTTWQEGTRLQPFPASLTARTVVFDPPYFDLDRAPAVQGVVNWGAHDPGVPQGSRPGTLMMECADRFGPYPAARWLYGFVWPSAARAAEMGASLTRAVDLRARAARWLLAERLPDWDLGIVVVSEPHSAIEALWHGVDETHPLHHLPSAGPAREGMVSVYRAVDRLVGEISDTFPDVQLLVFSMGGMGPNRSDVASMVLLPELMYRCAFGRPLLQTPEVWSQAPGGYPMVGENDLWAESIHAHIPSRRPSLAHRLAAALLPGAVKRALRGASRRPGAGRPFARLSLEWMPASRYQPYWRDMDAFALPSFYDGRIRINLAGRERHGRVPLDAYARTCDQVEAMLRECRDLHTGDGIVDFIERPERTSPLDMGPTESDLVVVWRGCVAGLVHPVHGEMGPVPLRRTGGHTGPHGVAYLTGKGIEPGARGVRSSFDVVPTMIGLLGEAVPPGLTGASLLDRG